MPTLFSLSSGREVHDINVASNKGRDFIIDITLESPGRFKSAVTVLDPIPPGVGCWIFETRPVSASAPDSFRAALELILKYLAAVDATDAIKGLHNRYNTPFVSQPEQEAIALSLKVTSTIRVN
jgi:hypothetical protein